MKRFTPIVVLALVLSACQDVDVAPTSTSVPMTTTTTTVMEITTTTTIAPTTTTLPRECTFVWESKLVNQTGVLKENAWEGGVLGPDVLAMKPVLIALRFLRSYSEEGQLILVFTHDDPSLEGEAVEVPLMWGPTSGYRDSTAFMPGLLLLYDPMVTGSAVTEVEPEYRELSASEVIGHMQIGCMYPLLVMRETAGFFPDDPFFQPLVAATNHNNAVVAYLAGESGREAVMDPGAIGRLHVPGY